MADPLLEALAARQAYQYQVNPYRGVGSSLLQTRGQLRDPDTNVYYQAGKGIFGGLLAGYGQGQAESNYLEDLGTASRFLNRYGGDRGALAQALIQEKEPWLRRAGVDYQAQEAESLASRQDKIRDMLSQRAYDVPKVLPAIKEGEEWVTYSQDPLSGGLQEISRGPRFRPESAIAPSGWEDPLITKGLSQLLQDEPITDPLVADALAKDPRALQRASTLKNQQQVQSRFEIKLSNEQAQKIIPTHEMVLGNQLTLEEAKQIRQKIQDTQTLKTNIDEAIRLGKEGNLQDYFGPNAALGAALYSKILNAWRLATNSGARFEAKEFALLQALTPAIMAGDPLQAIHAYLTDRDPVEFTKDLKGIIDKEQDYSLFASRGLKRRDVGWDYYSPELLKSVGLEVPAKMTEVQSPLSRTVVGPDGKERTATLINNEWVIE